MSNKFSAALKPVRVEPPAAMPVEEAAKAGSTAPSRRGAKHIGGYFDPIVAKQLRVIAAEEDGSVQGLLAEALDMLFQSRKKPMIAQKPSV